MMSLNDNVVSRICVVCGSGKTDCWRKAETTCNRCYKAERAKTIFKTCTECLKYKTSYNWYSGPTCSLCYQKQRAPLQRPKDKKYRADNKEKCRLAVLKWEQNNRGKCRAKWARRHAAKFQATPSWLTREQHLGMIRIYHDCPTGFHVDHVIPLRNDQVCGLHVPWNLQILPHSDNESKGNSFDGSFENMSWSKRR